MTKFLTNDYVLARVESAGKTLALFPMGFGKPQGERSCWPDTLKEMVIYQQEDGKGLEIIMPEPSVIRYRASVREHTELDEVIGWIQDYAVYCMEKNIRVGFVNVVWFAMRHHPYTGKRLMPWKRIGETLGIHRHTAEAWYAQAIDRMTAIQNQKIHSP